MTVGVPDSPTWTSHHKLLASTLHFLTKAARALKVEAQQVPLDSTPASCFPLPWKGKQGAGLSPRGTLGWKPVPSPPGHRCLQVLLSGPLSKLLPLYSQQTSSNGVSKRSCTLPSGQHTVSSESSQLSGCSLDQWLSLTGKETDTQRGCVNSSRWSQASTPGRTNSEGHVPEHLTESHP
jgi:hypothetical protein